MYYTETIADSPSKKLIKSKELQDKSSYIFQLGKEENVDAVYYVEFDANKIFKSEEGWSSLIGDAVLIWGNRVVKVFQLRVRIESSYIGGVLDYEL